MQAKNSANFAVHALHASVLNCRFDDEVLNMFLHLARCHQYISHAMALIYEQWAVRLQGRVLGPEPFSQQEVSSLFEQLVDARSGSLSESLEDWTSSLWSNTKGHRGLTAKCLLEVCAWLCLTLAALPSKYVL